MTAPAIHPDAITDALPDFDADVACEFDDEECDRPAVWRIRFHGVRRSTDESCGIHTVCMCDHHLNRERTLVEDLLRKYSTGAECRHCGLVVRQVSDILFSVVAL
ncbi:hypothetical protein SEA_OREGANO_56 [Gordonia phage Oregano]|nr:hypothetical protein SEA_OREGANO_56 [Gordonia phage Oregano]